MNRKALFDSGSSSDTITLFPGEMYATGKNEIITTLLGSCVSVVLIDGKKGICGMNHFMLPGYSAQYYTKSKGKYGIYAIEMLISEITALGGRLEDLSARVFGGGSMLQIESDLEKSIPSANVRFALEYLHNLSIPVISSDTGGTCGRKVYLNTESRTAYVKKIEKIRFKDIPLTESPPLWESPP